MRRWTAAALSLVSAGAMAVPVPGQGTWESALLARDVNNDGTVDAYYDTALDITWLADANYALTSGYVTPDTSFPGLAGSMSQPLAKQFTQDLNLHGITGWRLPEAFPLAGCGQMPYDCDGSPSELSHLMLTTLGGAGNTGPFINMKDGYWTGTEFFYEIVGPRTFVHTFDFIRGKGGTTDELSLALFAWAVHDGDIAAIPEPETCALMLAGLALLAARARRKAR